MDHNPSTPYAASKAAMEMMLDLCHRSYGFPYIITRSENVYGANQQKRLIPNAMDVKRKGAALALTSPNIERSFIHINDVCEALQTIMEKGTVGEIYNIGLGRPKKLSDVVEMIGAKWVKVPGRRVGDQYYGLCSDKLRELGWEPKYTLEKGLEQVWDERSTYYASQA